MCDKIDDKMWLSAIWLLLHNIIEGKWKKKGYFIFNISAKSLGLAGFWTLCNNDAQFVNKSQNCVAHML